MGSPPLGGAISSLLPTFIVVPADAVRSPALKITPGDVTSIVPASNVVKSSTVRISPALNVKVAFELSIVSWLIVSLDSS